jgi:hypothetical protein
MNLWKMEDYLALRRNEYKAMESSPANQLALKLDGAGAFRAVRMGQDRTGQEWPPDLGRGCASRGS